MRVVQEMGGVRLSLSDSPFPRETTKRVGVLRGALPDQSQSSLNPTQVTTPGKCSLVHDEPHRPRPTTVTGFSQT